MAAGLSMFPENLLQFKEVFSEAISNHLNGKKPALDLLTDGELDASEMTLKNAQLLCKSAPWGQGFEEPIFYGDFEILDQKKRHQQYLAEMLLGPTVYKKGFSLPAIDPTPYPQEHPH